MVSLRGVFRLGKRRDRDALTPLANRFGSTKGDAVGARHQYARIYASLLNPLRDWPIRLLEIGLLQSDDPRWIDDPRANPGAARAADASSLRMWAAFFPRATIYGFDINDFSAVSIERCKIVRGDMSSRDDLRRLAAAGAPFDVIVDDASHASHHQQIALGALFPHLADGGLYFIEDMHWINQALELPGAIRTRDVIRRLELTGEIRSPFMSEEEARYVAAHTAGVMMFDSLQRGSPEDMRDALAAIRKRRAEA